MNRLITSITHAFKWWLDGFQHLLPRRLQELTKTGSNSMLLALSENTLLCQSRSNSDQNILDEQTFQLTTPEFDRKQISRWLAEYSDHYTSMVYLVPANQLLHKEIILPAAAENDLEQILSFEMDRYTPFTTEHVYFDYTLKKGDVQNGQITVDLYVAQKNPANNDFAQLNKLGLQPDRIGSLDGNNNLLPVNLIPKEDRNETPRRNFRFTWALMGLVCLLYLASLVLPVQVRQSQIETLETQLAMVQSEAMQVQGLIKERNSLLAHKNFIAEKQHQLIPAIVLVNELSELLPDDTWLQRLIIKNNELHLMGESANASSLVTLLENSDHLQAPAFRSPVTRNQTTQKDKFQLIASLVGDP